MKDSIRIATVSNIPIELHISFWIPMVIVFLYSLLTDRMWIFAYVALLFLIVLIHEFSHSFVAKGYGVKIAKITLLPIGGIASMDQIPTDPRKEFHIAIAGPGINIVMATASYLILMLIPGGTENLFDISSYNSLVISNFIDFLQVFFRINLILGLFNLLVPAIPMDGGRVFRSLLAIRMGMDRATGFATGLAKIISIAMFFIGFLSGNIFLILISFFVYVGASQEGQAVILSGLLKNIKVKDIMSTDVISVKPQDTLSQFSDTIIENKHMGYPVINSNKVVGIITFSDLSKVPREQWDGVSLENVMSRNLITAGPETLVHDALILMISHKIGRLLVIEEGKLTGIVSKTDIIRMLDIMKLLK